MSRLAPGKKLVLILAKVILARTPKQYFSKVLLSFPSLRLCLVSAFKVEEDLQQAWREEREQEVQPVFEGSCLRVKPGPSKD